MLQDLRRLGELADPRTLVQLQRAGVLGPRDALGLALTLPWLLGRGQSLGIMSQAHALSIGDRPALHDAAGTLTFRELDARVNRAGHALAALGLRGGDRVALLVRNGRTYAEIVLAAQKLGLVACPLNTWAKPRELGATLRGCAPRVLVYDTRHADQLRRCPLEGVTTLWVGDASGALPGSTSYEDALASRPSTPPFPLVLHRGASKIVIHTSGTTGTPRGARRDAAAAGLRSMANLLQVVPYRRDDVVVCPAPLFHSFGLLTFTLCTVLGMTIVLPDHFDPEETLALIDRHRATAVSLVPVMIRRIVALDDDVKARYDLSSLRIVLASGSAMSAGLRRSAIATFGNVLYDLYGSTEAGWVSIATPRDMRVHPHTVGRPVPGIEVAVFSPDGRRLGVDEVGELFVRSAVTFEGYTGGDGRDEREGYMSIGDTVRIDDEGYIFVEGRADDMVVVGGENVYPVEIEDTIESIDGVREAAVLGIDDEEFGQVLAAFVKGDTDEATVRRVCEQELATYKVPKRIFVVDEFPRTSSTGKVVKHRLKEIAEQRAAEQARAGH